MILRMTADRAELDLDLFSDEAIRDSFRAAFS